ncbi:hypothetical protein PAXRUDRAFT_831276 [Paxillus rubicundulus Ve08.2h10]|uniref:Uncharacterized protein n=1 Tax=Paxillus rubicundulus Ve08.2h10 TaxID=930991 RepID=A0A0D0DXA8_9AGAM|nr:hypothetical protein PAXRUDRAFT_831276 [Paxillus rubicundulus Ve08.2h10]
MRSPLPTRSYSTSYSVLPCVAALSMFMLVSATPSSPPPPEKRDTNYGYYIPMDQGGSMLTEVPDTYPAGLGEPINAILSAYSDSTVLQNTLDNGGLINYYQSVGFSTECLGQHSGNSQGANLGDGNGYLNETAVIRWAYGDVNVGTCTETIEGGNHFRYWIQDGPDADSGAIFMAVSYEMPIAQQHNIVPNGYNLGRDWLIGNATAQSTLIPTENLTNASTYSGQTSFNGYTYQTSVNYVSGLLQNTSTGINHFQSVAVNGSNAIDGLVAIMTVQIVSRPTNSGGNTSGAQWSNRPISISWTTLVLVCLLIAASSL